VRAVRLYVFRHSPLHIDEITYNTLLTDDARTVLLKAGADQRGDKTILRGGRVHDCAASRRRHFRVRCRMRRRRMHFFAMCAIASRPRRMGFSWSTVRALPIDL